MQNRYNTNFSIPSPLLSSLPICLSTKHKVDENRQNLGTVPQEQYIKFPN